MSLQLPLQITQIPVVIISGRSGLVGHPVPQLIAVGSELVEGLGGEQLLVPLRCPLADLLATGEHLVPTGRDAVGRGGMSIIGQDCLYRGRSSSAGIYGSVSEQILIYM